METTEREKLPKVAFIAFGLLILAYLGIAPFSINERLPEVSHATYLEIRELIQTTDELLLSERFDVPARSSSYYERKEDWLYDIYGYSVATHKLVHLFAQGAELYDAGGASNYNYIQVLNAVIDKTDEFITILDARPPPDRWGVYDRMFVDGLREVKRAAELSIDCVHESDDACFRATLRMQTAFEQFGSVNGLLEWELRFEFDVEG